MGQYFLVVNLDKKEYLHPHKFGDGLKACEFGYGGKTMQALHALLTKSDDSGGGDYNKEFDPEGIVGWWAGDRIWIVGDCDSSGLYDAVEDESSDNEYVEISSRILPVIRQEYD